MRLELNGTSFDVKDIETISVKKTLDYSLSMFVIRLGTAVSAVAILIHIFNADLFDTNIYGRLFNIIEPAFIPLVFPLMIVLLGLVFSVYLYFSDWARRYEARLHIRLRSGKSLKSHPGYINDLQDAKRFLSDEISYQFCGEVEPREAREAEKKGIVLNYRIYRSKLFKIFVVMMITLWIYSFTSFYFFDNYVSPVLDLYELYFLIHLIAAMVVGIILFRHIVKPERHKWYLEQVLWKEGKIYRVTRSSGSDADVEHAYNHIAKREVARMEREPLKP